MKICLTASDDIVTTARVIRINCNIYMNHIWLVPSQVCNLHFAFWYHLQFGTGSSKRSMEFENQLGHFNLDTLTRTIQLRTLQLWTFQLGHFNLQKYDCANLPLNWIIELFNYSFNIRNPWPGGRRSLHMLFLGLVGVS